MLALVGISFKSAEIEIREQFAFSPEEIKELSLSLQKNPDFRGMVVLSTCNRTEIYFHCRKLYEHETYNLILTELEKFKNFNPKQRPNLYFKNGQNAVDHLFSVAAGIDSLVIGEDQIIGQVRNAFSYAQECKTVDTILSRLFAKAFEAAKKVKSTTTINQGSASVSSAAVDLCQKHFPNLSHCNLLLIGAGQTGRLVLTSLGKRKFKSICVANRTIAKADEIASQYNGKSIGLNEIQGFLSSSDIVIVATDSKDYLLNLEMVQSIKKNTDIAHKQLFIDLSVPRNIDPRISSFSEIKLYAVDDLTEIVNQTTQKRSEAINDALKLTSEISNEFMDWLVVRGLTPIFEKIKKNLHQIHKGEMESFVKINGISDQQAVEEYGKHISDKYARLLIRNLKNMVMSGESKDSIQAINELFELAD
jgi:glutamyl-tRNA reductase